MPVNGFLTSGAGLRSNSSPVFFYQDVREPVEPQDAAAAVEVAAESNNDKSVAVAGNNDAVEAEISGTIDIEPKDCDLALAQISKMRICVESLLAKLPDKYLETFQEAPKASLQNPEPVTYVRLI